MSQGVECYSCLPKTAWPPTYEYGSLMFDTLKKYGVDTSHLHVEKGDTAVFKMELNGNDRVHVECVEGVMKNFTLSDEDIEFIKKHDIVHTDLTGKVEHILPMLRENGIQIVFDFSIRLDNKNVENILPNVDYAFFSYKQEDSYIIDYMKWASRIVAMSFCEPRS